MGDGIYTALTGALATEHSLDVLANNLANASTAGFRADRSVFSELVAGAQKDQRVDPRQPAPPSTDKFVRVEMNQLDMTPGALRSTENPLDVGLSGSGYFMVRTAGGDLLTRAGNFRMREDGMLMNSEGALVIDESGDAIQLRREVRDVRVMADGTIRADDMEVAKLAVRDVRDPAHLLRKGLTTYAVVAGAELYRPENVEVVARHLEGSNVNVVSGMNQLITVNRSFDAIHKVIESFQSMDQRTARDIGSRTG